MTAVSWAAEQEPRTEPFPRWRRLDVAGDPRPDEIAREHGCDVAAIVGLFPFMVDDSFVTVVASSSGGLPARELLHALHARILRRVRADEIALSYVLGRPRHRVLMDERLLLQPELLFCVEPPRGYAAAAPEALRFELNARLITLR
jgi:hypothetical protein